MNPIPVFVGAFVANATVSQSGFCTFSYANSNGFDAYVPVVIVNPGTTSISAGGEVQLYRSMDGGTNYATEGHFARAFSKPTVATQVQRGSIRIPTGVWLVGVQVGGGSASTWTVQFQTANVITAYN